MRLRERKNHEVQKRRHGSSSSICRDTPREGGITTFKGSINEDTSRGRGRATC
jgi:hypothetical protein